MKEIENKDYRKLSDTEKKGLWKYLIIQYDGWIRKEEIRDTFKHYMYKKGDLEKDVDRYITIINLYNGRSTPKNSKYLNQIRNELENIRIIFDSKLNLNYPASLVDQGITQIDNLELEEKI